MKLLLVEDNIQLNKALSTLLKKNSYLVDSAFDGEEALIYLKDYQYDLIILDIMLPHINGLEVLKRARSQNIETPIILLTAKSTIEDKIVGLDLGADDYLAKPFSSEELLARIRALGRRKTKSYDEQKTVKYQDIQLDIATSKLRANNHEVLLSNKEMEILLLLINNKDKYVTSEDIASKAWEVESYSTSENVYVFISYLRKKLASVNSKLTIKSIRYQGYYLGEKNA